MTRAEIQALIDAAPSGKIGIFQAGRPRVVIPYGMHTLDGPLVINSRIEVDFSGAVLLVPDGVRAIEVGTLAWGSYLHDLCVFGVSQNALAHGAAGILVEAYGTEISRALVRFVGTGLDILGAFPTNANGCQIRESVIRDCDLGLHIKGGDTNGGTFAGLTFDVLRAGILDESFLGNHFSGCIFHTVREHAYRCTSAGNYSTFVGCSLENDCGSELPGGVADTIDDQPYETWLGGSASAQAKRGNRVGLNRSRIAFGDTMPTGKRIQVTIPHATAEAAITCERQDAAGATMDGFRLRWVDLLKQAGIEIYRPMNQGWPTGDGLTRPLAWTTVGNADGFGEPRLGAKHYSVGSASGAGVVRRVAVLPTVVEIGAAVEIVTAASRRTWLGVAGANGPAWVEVP